MHLRLIGGYSFRTIAPAATNASAAVTVAYKYNDEKTDRYAFGMGGGRSSSLHFPGNIAIDLPATNVMMEQF